MRCVNCVLTDPQPPPPPPYRFFMKDAKASGCDVHVDSRLISLGLQDGKWSELSEAVRPAGAICQQVCMHALVTFIGPTLTAMHVIS